MLVFEERGNRSTRRKNLSEQRREPTTNSTHIWHWRQDMNPGHIGGRGEQYFYPPMLALFAYLNTLICLFLFRNIQHPDHVRDDNYYVWTFCRLISVRSHFWSNLKLLKGRQTPVTFRNMETWSVNLIIFEIFICWWKTGWLNRCHNCVHIDVQSPIINWRGAWLKYIKRRLSLFLSEVAWGFIPGTCTSSKVFSALCFKILPKFMMKFS